MKEITFSYKAPTAFRVTLIGDFTHWQREPIALNKREEGIWQTQVRLGPGTHSYSFVVDDKWRDDGKCHVRVPRAQAASARKARTAPFTLSSLSAGLFLRTSRQKLPLFTLFVTSATVGKAFSRTKAFPCTENTVSTPRPHALLATIRTASKPALT